MKPSASLPVRIDMRKSMAVTLLLMLVAIPSLSASTFWKRGYSSMSESESVRDATETKVFRHKLRSDRTGTHLKVTVGLNGGTALLKVRDSEGTVRWERTFTTGETSAQQQIDGKPGVWQIELRLNKATGRYSVSLVDF